jgi:hypothetical protein
MRDKAERVAMRLWAPTYSPQDYLEKAAAILREEYPDEPTLDQLAKSQGVEPIEDMGTLVIPGLEDDLPIDPALDISALREPAKAEAAPDVSEAEKALCMDILGERGRSVDEVNRLATLLIDYREGLKAQTAPDLSELREALEGLYKIIMDEGARGVDDTIDKRSMIATAAALLRSEPKLGGTV